ncbi:MAG: diacylglycerol/lipid kinase family protein [Faecousia sp.]
MKKLLFIMNPFAGQKRANKALSDILLIFSQAGYEVITHMTTGQGDAVTAAQQWGRDVDVVVCCGGDGTLNETVTGLLRAGAETPIGYIPAGTTNDFASSLNLSGNMLQAARDIVEGEPVPYDVGRFGDRYFSYVASFGAFTRSSYVVPQNIKNALGHTAYVLGGISELSQIRKEHIRMEIDGQVVEDDFLFGAICNSTSIGGILTLDPKQVDMGDGLFEILLVRAAQNLEEIGECIRAVQSQKYNCEMITFRSARSVKIYADPEMPWTLDGEKEDGHEEVMVENLHHAIRLMQKRKDND